MALVKDKVVTVESLSALHEYNQETFMTKLDPSGSGTMTFDGDINTESLKVLNDSEIGGNQTVNGNIEVIGNHKVNGDIETVGNHKVNGNIEIVGSVSGGLDVNGDIIIQNINDGLYCIHPETEEPSSMVHMNPSGNTVIGYDGYANQNGSSFICGKDIEHHIASANNVHYRPYYRVGDVIDVHVRTSGYVTNMGTSVFFTIPLTKPVIGEPMLDITSDKGFILRQDGKYTHGCEGSTTPATYVQPINYSVDNNFNCGIIVTANFEDTTDVTNNDSIGIYADLRIMLIDPNATE